MTWRHGSSPLSASLKPHPCHKFEDTHSEEATVAIVGSGNERLGVRNDVRILQQEARQLIVVAWRLRVCMHVCIIYVCM